MKIKFLQNNRISVSSKGYTIIETMIAISIFLVLMMGGVSTLLNAFAVHGKSQNMRSEIDNLSFIMEDMSRNLRTGSQYYCITGFDTLVNVNTRKSSPYVSPAKQECWGIAFEPPLGNPAVATDQWVYYVDTNRVLWKATSASVSYMLSSPQSSTPPNNFIQLTPNNVKVEPNIFVVFGAEAAPADLQQPLVLIKLKGSVTEKDVVSPFSLETMVSQRLLDI